MKLVLAYRLLGVLGVLGLSLTWVGPLQADAPAGRYELRACGTVVYDTKTKLEWQRGVNEKRDVAEAVGICGSLRLDGSGWRVPTMLELVSIEDHTATNPAIDTRAFPGTPSSLFATGSQPAAPTNPPSYWTLDFATGVPDLAISKNPNAIVYSRCVRARK